jgi:lipopolysaccharide transport system ATP-binding protein
MSNGLISIEVQGLGKRYRIGEQRAQYRTIRETVTDALISPFKKALYIIRGEAYGAANLRKEIWALRDVSFEIAKGEVIGVIGKNGAGKTTLLKILSRITEPTEGIAKIKGRVGSLLEVGIGMHPELTGRENVYLNGAILGMKRSEMIKKYDQILEFSGVEEFIETPMKHYSSGMQVRLAFAIAAYLEPEILLVDEVLAVGDAEFQKKCIGKMEKVAESGRTVLFVSHNMQAIKSLCPKTMLLENGKVKMIDETSAVINEYLSSFSAASQQIWEHDEAPGDETIKLLGIRVLNEALMPVSSFLSDEQIYVEIKVDVIKAHSSLCVGFDLVAKNGAIVLRTYHNDNEPNKWPRIENGINVLRCSLPRSFLNKGTYAIGPKIKLHQIKLIIDSDPILWFDIELGHGVSPFWSASRDTYRPGVVMPILSWEKTE